MNDKHSANAFDAIRLAAAVAVLVSHSRGLFGLAEPQIFGSSLGTFSVSIFFAVSGYLVSQSWIRDPNSIRFGIRRALRIFPGLIFALLFTVFVAGTIDTTLSLSEYLASREIWVYFADNLALIGSVWSLPGAFQNIPHAGPANGSLWSLSYEVFMYVTVVCLGLTRSFKKLTMATFLLCTIAWMWMTIIGVENYKIPLPIAWRIGLSVDAYRLACLGAYFFGGAVLAQMKIRPSSVPIAFLMAVLALTLPRHLLPVVLAFGVPYVIVVCAFKIPNNLANLHGFDVSYGVYVYAYPVQQITTRYCITRGYGWISALAIELIIVFTLAIVSWLAIEKPALSLKKTNILKRIDSVSAG